MEGLTLYHRTTREAAAKILRTGRFESKESPKRAYFSTQFTDSAASSFGDAVVQVYIPAGLAQLDDEFPSGEQHYAVPVELIARHMIAQWFWDPRQERTGS